MRGQISRAVVLGVVLGAAVSGCADHAALTPLPASAPPPPPPSASRPVPPPPPARKGCPTEAACGTKENTARRQYYDARRKRYYYFDAKRHAYYWEDGEPKR